MFSPKIRRLWERGVKVCINSDDPTLIHDVWIDGNMQKVFTYGGFSKGEMVQLVRGAVEEHIKKAIYQVLEGVDV